MKSNSLQSRVGRFVLLLAVCASTMAVAQQLPVLKINPTAVTLPAKTSQYFLASFSDGSQVESCKWTATGVGANGITLTTTDKDWAVFFDGWLQGKIYQVSAECQNSVGVKSSATAYVFVQ